MYYRPALHQRLAGFRDFIETRNRRRLTIWLAVILVVGLTLIISSTYLPSRYQLEPGDLSPRTFTAPRSVTFEDEQATEELRKEAISQSEPVYRTSPGTLVAVSSEVRSLFDQVKELQKATSGQAQSADAIAQLRAAAPSTVPDDGLRYLLLAQPSLLDQMQQEILSALRLIYNKSVTEESLPEQRDQLSAIIASSSLPEAGRLVATEIASGFLRSNVVLDEQATEQRRQEAAASVVPVLVSVVKGETIARTGDPLTSQQILVLEQLGLVGSQADWRVWLGVLLVVLLELTVLALFLRRFGSNILGDNNLMLAGATLLLLFAIIARLLAIPPLSAYLIPMATVGLVGSIVLGARVSAVMVVISALNLGIITRLELQFTIVAMLSGLCAIYLVSHLMERSELLSAGLWTTLFTTIVVFAAELLTQAPIGESGEFALWGLGAGLISLILSITLLEVFEVVFNLTTPLRLLELGNPAQPLLRRLMQEAPGTYNHSIMVGNLAEAAAEAVGADPLLTRVGAYYHDIGKINRPEYFIENQLQLGNPHDKLTPNLSKLAITAHVGDGVDLAKQYGLPKPVVEIVKQHHGTSVLSYFYYKARQDSKAEVPEENYRYEEDKPTSREAAIIMLADSVEAAVKAMQHPTVKKIQILIRDVIRQKMEDGQLDRSQLTFGDLHKIAEAFEVVLRGVVGHRIEYPEERPAAARVRPVEPQPVGARAKNGRTR